MNRNEVELRYDVEAGKLFAVFLLINGANIFLKTIGSGMPITRYLSPLLGIIFVVSYFRKKIVFSYTFLETIGMEFVFFVFVYSSILRYASVASAIEKRCLWLFALCVPLFCISRHVRDIEIFIKQTRHVSLIVSAMGVLMFIYARRSGSHNTYSMTMSYMMLYPALVHIIQIKENKFYLILTLLEVAIIFLYGSRGALFVVALFVGLRFLFERVKTRKQIGGKAVFLLTAIIIIITVYLNAGSLLNYFTSSGRMVRTAFLILSGAALSHDSGRFAIYQMVLDRIMEKPLLGWGIAGELSFMNTYSHNMFLDLLLQFGIPFGSVFSLAIIAIIFYGIYKYRNNCAFFLILFCAGFLPLMVSETYIQQPIFWVLMGIAFPLKKFSRIRGKV